MLKTSDFNEIRRRIESAPFTCIRLVNESGEKIISRANASRPEMFLGKVEKILSDFSGTGHFQGKQSIQDKSWINMFSVSSGTPALSAPAPISAGTLKAEANFSLLQENSKLQSRCEVLEYQNRELSQKLADLENQVKDLEEQIADLEEEEKPVLSEQQNMLMKFAEPLLPGIQALAFSYLQKYLPQNPAQPQIPLQNELPGEEGH